MGNTLGLKSGRILGLVGLWLALGSAACDHNKTCLGTCEEPIDCPPGTVASENACVPLGCTSGDECGDGLACEFGECIAYCGHDLDCRGGEICGVSGVCERVRRDDDDDGRDQVADAGLPPERDAFVDEGEVPDADRSSECDGSPGVPDAGPAPGPAPGTEPAPAPECYENCDCPSGQYCGDGRCVLPPVSPCQFNVDCGLGRVCVDVLCLPLCGADGGCPAGSACDGELCRPGASESISCATDADCGAMSCVDGECGAACVADEECGREERCEGLVCRLDTDRRAMCEDASQCRAGQSCLGQVCRSVCEIDGDCGAGRACDGGACVGVQEVSPECRASADCPPGRECRDARCVLPR